MMSDRIDNPNAGPAEGKTPFDRLGEAARADQRPVPAGEPLSDVQRREIIADVLGYRDRHRLTYAQMGTILGVGGSTLRSILQGTYTHPEHEHLRRFAEILDREEAAGDRPLGREFQYIRIVENAFGAFRTALKYQSIGVLISEPGSGKTEILKAFIAQHQGGLYHRVTPDTASGRGIRDALCRLVGTRWDRTGERRLRNLIAHLAGTRLYIALDEAQRLTASGLEMVRTVHDCTETRQAGLVRRTAFLLTGDHAFYKLIVGSRDEDGAGTKIEPQLVSRMYPVYDLSRALPHRDGDGNPVLYSVEEIREIIQQRRLRLLTDEAVDWLTVYANLPGFGRLRAALSILDMALETRADKTQQVTRPDLVRASSMVIGPEALQLAVGVQPRLGGSYVARAAVKTA